MIRGKRVVLHAIERGAGWRVDCWGDLRGDNWNHQYDRYPQYIYQTGSVDAWKTAPVVLETCGTYGSWFRGGLDLDLIHEEALRWHAVSVHGKSSAIPKPTSMRFRPLPTCCLPPAARRCRRPRRLPRPSRTPGSPKAARPNT